MESMNRPENHRILVAPKPIRVSEPSIDPILPFRKSLNAFYPQVSVIK